MRIPAVQTFLVQKASSILSEELGAHVDIRSVNIGFFDKVILEDVIIEDQNKDTLLHAGQLKVKINDWFFLKDNIELKYIGLEDVTVNMNRQDEKWNYQFIADYFAGPKKQQKKKNKVQLSLKEITAKNIRFKQIDGWVGRDMIVGLLSMHINVEEFDLMKKNIRVKNIKLDKPIFEQSDYTGNRPDNFPRKPRPPKLPSQLQWNKDGWNIELEKIDITKGEFKSDKETKRAVYADMFDGQHLHFTGISGTLYHFSFKDDTLRTHAKLQTVERSGLQVDELNADIKFTPDIFEFKNLTLKTPKSDLKDYYSMSYEDFKPDMSDFIHKVTLEAHFDSSSYVHTDDIAIFAPALRSWHRQFHLKGDFKGTIDNFMARNVQITSGMSGFKGDVALRGLPDIRETFLDIRAEQFVSHYREIITIVPRLKNVTTPALNSLGAIRFKGAYTGFIDDFVVQGDIQTQLGRVQADLNLKLPNNDVPAYAGNLNAKNFHIGKFLAIPKVGNITFNGNVNGQGFSPENLNVNFDGHIQSIEHGKLTYKDITVTGDFDPNFFVGHLEIKDPKLEITHLDGTIRLIGKNMEINADAHLAGSDLKALGVTQAQMNLAGDFSVNFTGSNIDDFLGYAGVRNATLYHNQQLLTFDSLVLISTMEEDLKTLMLQTNELDAKIKGRFNILDLPNSFKFFLSRYYPNYIGKPNYAVSDQDFQFNITTKSVDEYIRLFDPRLKGFNYSTITGSLNIIESDFKLNAHIPSFQYQNVEFNELALAVDGSTENVGFDITTGNIKISDSLQFPKTNIKVVSSNDLSFINIQTSADKTLNEAVLNASVQTLQDGVNIKFFPSSFILNNKKWTLERDGELTLRKHFINANEIRFQHENQQIIIDTELSDETDQTHLTARFKNVELSNFTPLFIKKTPVAGALTGDFYLYNLYGKRSYHFEGNADSFALNNSYIGKTKLMADLNEADGILNFKVVADDTTYKFDMAGQWNSKDSIPNLNIDLKGNTVNLEVLKPYLSSVFSDMEGVVRTEHLNLSGPTKHLVITGDAYIDSASFVVAYTQCRYHVKNQIIRFKEDEIDLGTLQIFDDFKNTGTFSGKIQHEFFDKLFFDNIRFETGKMLLLNTTARDNQQFYGNVIGNARMRVNGPLSNVVMDLRGQPSAIDTSHIFLPVGESSVESAKVDYIDFIQFGELMATPRFTEQVNILVTLEVEANPACKVNVILDEETGDEIKAQGTGNLSIRVGSVEPLSIRGRYVLTKGEYNFNFQTFFQKPFILTEGGSISWNGDPYSAIIDIDAEYIAKNVDVSVLATAGGFRQKEDVTIIAHLTGILQKPDIEFDINLPDKSEIKNDYIAIKKMADFKNDQAEMNKQVASLLLFNTFIAGTQSFLTAENSLNYAASTIGGMMSSLLTRMFNRELEKATNGFLSTYVDINPSINLQTAANQLQANVRAGLKLLLSKRLFILVGGNLEYNNPATLQLARRGLLTPDITLEWLLNKDGSLRVVGFNRTSIDLTIGQRNRSGVQLSYRKDFHRLSDVFKSKKKIDALHLKRRMAYQQQLEKLEQKD